FLRADEVPAHASWRLLEWCRQRGSDEFSIAMISVEGSGASRLDKVTAALSPFERPATIRQHLTGAATEGPDRTTNLWALTPETIQLLKEYFREGLFMRPTYEDDGWLEDPTFYRGGRLMLGIVSHEGEGVLALTAGEHEEIDALGLTTHQRGR